MYGDPSVHFPAKKVSAVGGWQESGSVVPSVSAAGSVQEVRLPGVHLSEYRW